MPDDKTDKPDPQSDAERAKKFVWQEGDIQWIRRGGKLVDQPTDHSRSNRPGSTDNPKQ